MFKNQLYFICRLCSRNKYLDFILSVIVFILALSVSMLAGVILSIIVAFFTVVYTIVIVLCIVFDEIWEYMHGDREKREAECEQIFKEHKSRR